MRLFSGTYNTQLLAQEAARLVLAHDTKDPFYMYLAFMAVHDGCGDKSTGKQAPLETVQLYNRTVLDTYKVAGAMYTELDAGIEGANAIYTYKQEKTNIQRK